MSENIKDFYNEFSKKQISTGVNLRHYYLFKKIVQSGLKKDHNILEIGCGIATLTGLLSKYLKKGKIVAVDISPENIEVAKKRLQNRENVKFLVSDMKDFDYPEKFDFVILADVLEHIPKNFHNQLFQTISQYMNEKAVLFINIPHPKNIEYLEKHSPEKMQIVDQALYADEITKSASVNGLIVKEYISYPLYHKEDDYNIIKLKFNTSVEYHQKSNFKIIFEKTKCRIFYFLSKL
jgi:2-polyprenyl-3-methyl-5-hydroxy-6-metoxy-1,4-benzoquinol methylase